MLRRLGITFYDGEPEVLRFRKEDIRNLVRHSLVALHRMLTVYVRHEDESQGYVLDLYEDLFADSPIWRAVSTIYDYVNDGIFPEVREDDLHEYLKMAISFRAQLIFANEFFEFDLADDVESTNSRYSIAIYSGRALEILICTFMARWKLDVEHDESNSDLIREWLHMFEDNDEVLLSLTEVALLADVQERSVRNYMHSTRPDEERLPIVRVKGRTYVEPAAAKAWLSRRRRFVPTRFTATGN